MVLLAAVFIGLRLAGFETGYGLQAVQLIGAGLTVVYLLGSLSQSEWMNEEEEPDEASKLRAAERTGLARWVHRYPYVFVIQIPAALLYIAGYAGVAPYPAVLLAVIGWLVAGSIGTVLGPPLWRRWRRRPDQTPAAG